MTDVLIVDDDEDVGWVFKEILQVGGISARCARTRLEAVAMLATDSPRLVLMDVVLDGDSGIRAAHDLREAGFQGPIIGISSIPDPDQVFDSWLHKPVGMADIIPEVKKWLER